MRLAIFGPPGAGKGTQACLLSQRYDLAAISTGDLIRDAIAARSSIGVQAETFVKKGDLVPGEIVRKLANQAISGRSFSNFILDGYPRTLEQAGWLSDFLIAFKSPLQGVIDLAVPDEVLIHRLSRRRIHRDTGEIFNLDYNPPPAGVSEDILMHRPDDYPEAIAHRLVTYREETLPVEDFYRRQGVLIQIDGFGDVDEVQSRVVAEIDRITDHVIA